MIMDDFLKAANIVVSLPYFWNAMSWSTIIALLSSSIIYDGCVPHAKRGVWSVVSYMTLLFMLMSMYANYRYPLIKAEVAYQLFVYPLQLAFLSFFWLVGFVLGIIVFRIFIKCEN